MQLFLTNKDNKTLDLLNNRGRFILYKADAMHGIDTDIAETESPYIDGVEIDNVRALPRGIELGFKLVGDVSENIKFFTSYIKSKQLITLREVDGERDIYVKGIATIPPYSRMLAACEITLTIYCGQPYWEDLNTVIVDLANEINLLYFPQEGQYFTQTGRPFGEIDTDLEKVYTNEGDVTVGFEIELVAIDKVENVRISCASGEQNGNYMQLNTTLQPNDILYIKTVKGQKEITINGSSTYNGNPILNYLEFKGEDWLQLETGDNTFNITSGGTPTSEKPIDVYFTIKYRRRYE